jgi:hypothetical protein
MNATQWLHRKKTNENEQKYLVHNKQKTNKHPKKMPLIKILIGCNIQTPKKKNSHQT